MLAERGELQAGQSTRHPPLLASSRFVGRGEGEPVVESLRLPDGWSWRATARRRVSAGCAARRGCRSAGSGRGTPTVVPTTPVIQSQDLREEGQGLGDDLGDRGGTAPHVVRAGDLEVV